MEKLKALVLNHESHLRGIFECSRNTCDEAYYKKYCQLQERMARYFEDFLRLKTDLGKYAGNVLKRRKPIIQDSTVDESRSYVKMSF